MNEIYVFWAEVNAGRIIHLSLGLVRIREALSLDSSIQPGRLLIHAYEALEHLSLDKTMPLQSSRSTETIIKEMHSHHDQDQHSKIEMDSKDEELLLNRGIDLLMGQKSI